MELSKVLIWVVYDIWLGLQILEICMFKTFSGESGIFICHQICYITKFEGYLQIGFCKETGLQMS